MAGAGEGAVFGALVRLLCRVKGCAPRDFDGGRKWGGGAGWLLMMGFHGLLCGHVPIGSEVISARSCVSVFGLSDP